MSSILYRWDNAFNTAVGLLLNGTWSRFAYEGYGKRGLVLCTILTNADCCSGFKDGSLRMAAFGNAYRLNETAKRIVDEKLQEFYNAVKMGTQNGFCNVTSIGLTPGTPPLRI